MERLYETLLQLPLFQGITLYDFNNLIGKLKWHFDKYKPGDKIVASGSKCDNVVCVLSGEVSCTVSSANDLFSITEFYNKPFVLEPYSMTGINNTYQGTYSAVTETTVGVFTKLSYFTIVNDFIICRLNIINLLCNRTQNLYKRLWSDDTKNDFQSKIIRFIIMHCEKREGKKIIKIRLYDFAKLINTSHVNTSIALNQMEKEGLIKLERMSIIVPDVALLIQRY
jgi:hypothetical protein